MKKVLLITIIFLCVAISSLAAQSYKNNEFAQLARQYNERSQTAFDNGEYDLAVEYSLLAEENAELSELYISEMLAKYEANTRIIYARNRVVYARGISADVYYPMAFETGEVALENALLAYEMENWATATLYAEESLAALDGIKEVKPLPEYYVVTPWSQSKDCYWNISGKPYVYNNPLLWENLYQSNKDSMSDPNNPDLIHPGMKMYIPSLTGEIREGVYSPNVSYDTYGAQE